MKVFPPEMSQYSRRFCSTRIPELKKDKLATYESGRHIFVMRKVNFYVFDTITIDGKISKIFNCFLLKHIFLLSVLP